MLKRVRDQKGVGLIEVLASMLILGVGVLGMLSVQTRSVQFNKSAMFESQAIVLAGDIMDRVRANVRETRRYTIDFNEPNPNYVTCDGGSAECAPHQLADYDVATWRTEIAAILPDGNGEITMLDGEGGAPIFTVIIRYRDERVESGSARGQGESTFHSKQVVSRTSI